MALTGKTGADAIFKALDKICHVLVKYETKLNAVNDAALAASAITSTQHAAIVAVITTATAACEAFRALAQYSGF